MLQGFHDWAGGRHHRTIRQRLDEAELSSVAAPWDSVGSGGVGGMAPDSAGRPLLWAACPGGVCVLEVHTGVLLGVVVTRARVGSCLVGGDGALYIAAAGELVRMSTTSV